MQAVSHTHGSSLGPRLAVARTAAHRIHPGCSRLSGGLRRCQQDLHFAHTCRRRLVVRADSGIQRPSGARMDPVGSGPAVELETPPPEPWWKRFLLPLAWISALLSRFPQWAARKKLANLKEAAEADPDNAGAQLAYLQELNRKSPEQVIEYMREGKFITSEAIVVEYIKALVNSGQLSEYAAENSTAEAAKADHRSLPTLLEQLKASAAGESVEFAPGDSSRRPLHVVVGGAAAAMGDRGAVGFLKRLFSSILMIVILAFVWLVGIGVARKYAGSVQGSSLGTGAMGTPGGSHAPKEYNKENMPEKSVRTFKDVYGCDEAKAELEEIVEYLKTPEKFTRLGGKLPKGVLLTGPPGTGKTLLARAIAGEAGVPFFYRAGSEFEEMFVGVGSRRVRSLFAAAKKKAPCIVFVDEIDAVGGNRKQWESHSRKTLNQMLVEMDGFEANEGIIVVAATNLPETLDPALTRPGRFDRHVAVPLPDVSGRLDILEHYMKDKPMSEEVDRKLIARNTPGFSGAQLANLVNEAALIAAKTNKDTITPKMIDDARDKILMGVERKSLTQSDEARKLTAYHEGGHALVAMLTQGANPIHKATIIPRGHALGMVTQLPGEDEFSITREQMLARIDVCMGGKVAEELIFGSNKVTSGATNDLKQATSMAQHMVSDCGMSDDIGPMHVDTMLQQNRGAGGALRQKVDEEVSRLLRDAYKRVTELLSTNEHKLHDLASALLEYETLTQQQIRSVLDGTLQVETPGGPESPAEEKAEAGELEEETRGERIPVTARAADAPAAASSPAIGNN